MKQRYETAQEFDIPEMENAGIRFIIQNATRIRPSDRLKWCVPEKASDKANEVSEEADGHTYNGNLHMGFSVITVLEPKKAGYE